MVATGVNVDERDANGATALYCAALYSCNGHVEVMRALVELSADKEAKGAHGGTPLHAAAAVGHVEAIKLLVQLGVDKEAKDADGDTPLHYAAPDCTNALIV